MEECEQPNNDAMSSQYNASSVHQVLQNETRDGILEMLQQKIDSDCFSEIGDTVLHSVLRNEKLLEKEVVGILTIFLTRGVGSNIVNILEETALHLAVERRMKDAVNLLLKFKSNIHKVNERGNSIAHFFVEDEYEKRKVAMRNPLVNTEEIREMMENDSVNFLEFFMSKDVDFDRKNERGDSALYLAITYQLQHFLPTLLEHTNDIMFVDKNNKTLLDLFLEGRSRLSNERLHSVRTSRYAAKIVKILLNRGVPIPTGDEFSAANYISKIIQKREQLDIIEALIDHHLNSCDDRTAATTLFRELISTCALWTDVETDYFLTVLRDLVINGVDINKEWPQNRLFLMDRGAKNVRVLEFLKESGLPYSVRSSYVKTMLHMLAEQRDYQGSSSELHSHIRNLVFDGGCDVNVADENGKSVLQTAVGANKIAIVRVLIELGADVNSRDDDVRTPLHDAVAANKSEEMIDLLLSNGADVNAQDHAGETPLHSAVAHENLTIARLLLERGASVNCDSKCQPLHRVRWAKDEAAGMIFLLLSRGADVNAEDHAGVTPLHMAVSESNAALVRYLLDRGASVNCKDANFEQTPLHRACCRATEAVGIVQLLLTSGADVHAKDYYHETPLHEAVSKNYLSIVRLLIEHGASVDCEDRIRRTPLHRALAIDTGVEIVELLLACGANVNAKDYNGDTPLHQLFKRSALDDCKPILKMLMERGARVNARNNRGKSAFCHALSRQNSVSIDELLRYGADVNDRKVRDLVLSCLRKPRPSFLQQYLLKFKIAELPYLEEYECYIDNIRDHERLNACVKEVGKLKTTPVGNGKSLYEFLRANPTRRGAYVNCEVVQQLVESPRLDEQFPMYSDVILAKYRQAVTRKSLLALAEEAFYELIQGLLPDIINHILAYLTDEDLNNIICTADTKNRS